VIHKDKVESWISKGAQPSEQAASLLRSLGIALHRASQSPKKTAAGEPKAKKAVKRAVPRKMSERKTKKKAARKAAKKKAAVKA
jgi:hypothetical protein